MTRPTTTMAMIAHTQPWREVMTMVGPLVVTPGGATEPGPVSCVNQCKRYDNKILLLNLKLSVIDIASDGVWAVLLSKDKAAIFVHAIILTHRRGGSSKGHRSAIVTCTHGPFIKTLHLLLTGNYISTDQGDTAQGKQLSHQSAVIITSLKW